MVRGTRSFRYGPRLKLTAPMAAMFAVVAAEMWIVAFARDGAWRYAFGVVGALSTVFALGLIREVMGRLRGKRQIVVGAKELAMPGGPTIQLRDVKALAITGEKGFRRELTIEHGGGTLAISGVMLGSVGELDELHGLIRSAGPGPREGRPPKRRGRAAARR